jgi:AcrR family transcriptional regulator
MADRSYHHGNLRAALLERAEVTLREHGVQALSLRELAREAGVSHGAPRRHFPDRQALLDALAKTGFERLGRRLAAAVEESAPGIDARLEALGHAYVDFATGHAALLELMFAGKHRPGADDVAAAAAETMAVCLTVIVTAQRAGELAPGDAESVAQTALATLHGLATLANGGMLAGGDLDGAVTNAIGQLMSGLRPRS